MSQNQRGLAARCQKTPSAVAWCSGPDIGYLNTRYRTYLSVFRGNDMTGSIAAPDVMALEPVGIAGDYWQIVATGGPAQPSAGSAVVTIGHPLLQIWRSAPQTRRPDLG